MRFHAFLKDWSLPIAMIGGVLAYIIYVNIPILDTTHTIANKIVEFLQPALIFSMLFVTFCKIEIKELRPTRWHFKLLAFQLSTFIIFSLLATITPAESSALRVILETFMVCLICPTATAAAVITAKLNGNSASIITYTILINISVALVAPFFLTLSHPLEGHTFLSSFLTITKKVFPLLLCPLIAAETVRNFIPRLHHILITKCRNLPFYLWLVALSLAIAMTTRAIFHSNLALQVMGGIVVVSFICCMLQFMTGRFIGRKYGEHITAGQALGQKNTVFAIWLAYTFLTPVTAIAGGFYSLWHNMVNTWQLYWYNHRK